MIWAKSVIFVLFKESPEIKGIETTPPSAFIAFTSSFKESPEIKGIETGWDGSPRTNHTI